MRRVGALVLAMAVLLLTACGKSDSKPSQSTVTVGRPSVTTTITTTTVTNVASATDDTTATTPTDITSATESPLMTTGKVTTTTSSVVTVTTTTQNTTTTTKGESQTTTTTTTTTDIVTTTTTRPTAPSTSNGEVRGAWVSYIELADVLQRCSTPAQAKAALDDMMARLHTCRFNTVFFHVRANSDAYYKSSVFRYAAVVEKLLNAGFDPLAYAVEAAHKRGMELHAWVNPYRIGKNAAYTVSNVPTLTDAAGRQYYVPTSSKAQSLILRGVREILENYDVDGIQYDDYFYPEGLLEENTVYGFESGDYEQYRESGGTLSVGDWRRAGVDALIAGTHLLTKSHNVVFGVSPAVSADNTYKALYADCRKWLAEDGFVDYLCPQIYTGFEHANSPFDAMVNTWQSYPRHQSVDLYVGVALYKIGLKSDTYAGSGKTEWHNNSDVMQRSVTYLRNKNIKGICLYSYSYLYPQEKAGLSQTNDVAVATREVKNLLSIW